MAGQAGHDAIPDLIGHGVIPDLIGDLEYEVYLQGCPESPG